MKDASGVKQVKTVDPKDSGTPRMWNFIFYTCIRYLCMANLLFPSNTIPQLLEIIAPLKSAWNQ